MSEIVIESDNKMAINYSRVPLAWNKEDVVCINVYKLKTDTKIISAVISELNHNDVSVDYRKDNYKKNGNIVEVVAYCQHDAWVVTIKQDVVKVYQRGYLKQFEKISNPGRHFSVFINSKRDDIDSDDYNRVYVEYFDDDPLVISSDEDDSIDEVAWLNRRMDKMPKITPESERERFADPSELDTESLLGDDDVFDIEEKTWHKAGASPYLPTDHPPQPLDLHEIESPLSDLSEDEDEYNNEISFATVAEDAVIDALNMTTLLYDYVKERYELIVTDKMHVPVSKWKMQCCGFMPRSLCPNDKRFDFAVRPPKMVTRNEGKVVKRYR